VQKNPKIKTESNTFTSANLKQFSYSFDTFSVKENFDRFEKNILFDFLQMENITKKPDVLVGVYLHGARMRQLRLFLHTAGRRRRSTRYLVI